MVWVCFGAGKVGDLYKVKGILNKEGYMPCHTLWTVLVWSQFPPTTGQWPKLCENYLGKKQSDGILSVMEWPAQSPDLNPIELLWERLDRMVHKKCPSSQSNLWEVLQEAWGEIYLDYLNKLTARMPKVCKAVIAAN